MPKKFKQHSNETIVDRRKRMGQHEIFLQSRVSPQATAHSELNDATNIWYYLYKRWASLNTHQKIACIVVGLIFAGVSLYIAYQLAPLIYNNISKAHSDNKPNSTDTITQTLSNNSKVKTCETAQKLVEAAKILVPETRNQETPLRFDKELGLLGKASQKTLYKYNPLQTGMFEQRDYVLSDIVLNELKKLQKDDPEFNNYCIQNPHEVNNVLYQTMGKIYAYLSIQYPKGTCASYARTLEALARDCLTENLYLVNEDYKECSYNNDTINDHTVTIIPNTTIKLDPWVNRNESIYVDNTNSEGDTWPLKQYHCKKVVKTQIHPVPNSLPQKFKEWWQWAVKKTEQIAKENLPYGYDHFTKICHYLQTTRKDFLSKDILKHGIFCQHATYYPVNKVKSSTQYSVNSISNGENIFVGEDKIFVERSFLMNKQMKMMTGLSSTFFHVYKLQIKEIFKQQNVADLSVEEIAITNILVSIYVEAEIADTTHFMKSEESVAVSMGKYIVAHLFYQEPLPCMIAIRFNSSRLPIPETLKIDYSQKRNHILEQHSTLLTIDEQKISPAMSKELEHIRMENIKSSNKILITEGLAKKIMALLLSLQTQVCDAWLNDTMFLSYQRAENNIINLLINNPELIQDVTILRADLLQRQVSQIILNEFYIKKKSFWDKIVNANIFGRNAQPSPSIGA